MTHPPPRILVVEDEGIVAWDIQKSLGDLGFEVTGVAGTAEEALKLASESRPDLVLMDIHIRGPEDGIAAAEALRTRFGMAVVYLTAHGDAETIERARRTAPLAYLIKPFKKTELYSSVQIALARHQLELQLRERERLWATTLRSITDAVVTTDAAGNVAFVNPAAEALTGWAQADAAGRSLSEVLQLRDERTSAPLAPLERALRERAACAVEALLLRRDGMVRPVSGSLAPVVDADAVRGSVTVLRDLTEQRHTQARLEQQDRLASLGALAAGVAHEINNPLAFITANLSYVVEELGHLPAEQQGPLSDVLAALSEANDGAKRVARIVADLRQLSLPPEAGEMEANVQQSVEWAVDVSTPQWKHCARVVRDLQPVPPAAIDRTRLGQVLVNLLVNAAHAIEPGHADRNEIRVRTFTDVQGRAVVEVEDTGAGMPEDVRTQLFTPFFTTKARGKGTGLGLSICHGIAQSVGADLEVWSEVGRGSTFRLSIPPAFAPAAPKVKELRPAAPASPRGRVMAIDDETPVLRAIERALGGRHVVRCVASAREALDELAAKAAPEYDVILCDLMMPQMTGSDFYRLLKTARPDLVDRVIFLTGGTFTPSMDQFIQEVTNLRVDKPFDLDHLRRRPPGSGG